MRGKLGGLFSTAESLGRFIGPAGFSITYAWSISPSGIQNHYFVFVASAAVLAMCALLAWPTLTAENLIKRDKGDERDGYVAIADGGTGSAGAGCVKGGRVDSDFFASPVDGVKRESSMV